MSPDTLRRQLHEAAEMAVPPRAQDLTRLQKQNILLSVTCPKCKAPEDRRCGWPGKTNSTCHSARYAEVSARKLVTW